MNSLYLAAGLALIALPANAAVQLVQPGAPAKSAKSAKAGNTTKYCLTYEAITGSRIGKTECKTKAEWERAGVDIEALAAK